MMPNALIRLLLKVIPPKTTEDAGVFDEIGINPNTGLIRKLDRKKVTPRRRATHPYSIKEKNMALRAWLFAARVVTPVPKLVTTLLQLQLSNLFQT